MFASSVLSYVKLMAKDLWEDEDLLEKATKMKEEVDEGIAVSHFSKNFNPFKLIFFYSESMKLKIN